MKRRRILALLALAATFSPSLAVSNSSASSASSTTVVDTSAYMLKYMSTNLPECDDALSHQIVTLYNQNRNVYAQCVAESTDYSLFPFSGYLPSDAQIVAMVSSLSCLYFFQAVLALQTPLPECTMSGLDLKSALETLLMTSQDVVTHVTPLTCEQFVDFITWRHTRNIAQENAQPYDASSESAVAFDRALKDASERLQVTLNEELQIQVKGQVVGSNATLRPSTQEAREASESVQDPTTVPSSRRDKLVKPAPTKSTAALTRTASPWLIPLLGMLWGGTVVLL